MAFEGYIQANGGVKAFKTGVGELVAAQLFGYKRSVKFERIQVI